MNVKLPSSRSRKFFPPTMPALLMRMETGPTSSLILSHVEYTASRFVRSQVYV